MIFELLAILFGIAFFALVLLYIQKLFYTSFDLIHNFLIGRKYKNTELIKTDTMSGREFEEWLMAKYKQLGYKVVLTPQSKDHGADLIVTDIENNSKTAVQAKQHSKKENVGVDALGEVLRGYHNYKCTHKAIVTNQYFSRQVKYESKNCDVKLIDRDELTIMLQEITKLNRNNAAQKKRVNADHLI